MKRNILFIIFLFPAFLNYIGVAETNKIAKSSSENSDFSLYIDLFKESELPFHSQKMNAVFKDESILSKQQVEKFLKVKDSENFTFYADRKIAVSDKIIVLTVFCENVKSNSVSLFLVSYSLSSGKIKDKISICSTSHENFNKLVYHVFKNNSASDDDKNFSIVCDKSIVTILPSGRFKLNNFSFANPIEITHHLQGSVDINFTDFISREQLFSSIGKKVFDFGEYFPVDQINFTLLGKVSAIDEYCECFIVKEEFFSPNDSWTKIHLVLIKNGEMVSRHEIASESNGGGSFYPLTSWSQLEKNVITETRIGYNIIDVNAEYSPENMKSDTIIKMFQIIPESCIVVEMKAGNY